MAGLTPKWTDEQILEINVRAIELYQKATRDRGLPMSLDAGIYEGILNMCGQVEITEVARPQPRMDILRGRG